MPQQPADAPIVRVVVYGSCVARDTIDLAAAAFTEVPTYVARQSLLSAGSDASAQFPRDAPIDSAFQKRQMASDFAGNLDEQLRSIPADVDVLLWDLTDERHGVHVFDDGTVVTRSIDLVNAPQALAAVDGTRHIPFGTDEHFETWTGKADAFVARLKELHLFERTVVLQVPWALVTKDGNPTPWSMGVSAGDANEAYRRYYQHLHDLGFAVLELQPLAVLADPDHRWGLAPFHYTPDVYREIIRRLTDEHGVPFPLAEPEGEQAVGEARAGEVVEPDGGLGSEEAEPSDSTP